MVLCVAAFIVLGFLGIFSAKYRRLAGESFRCTFKIIRLKPCETDLDQRIRSKITAKLIGRSQTLAKAFYRSFKALAWISVVTFFVGVLYAVYVIYNYYLCVYYLFYHNALLVGVAGIVSTAIYSAVRLRKRSPFGRTLGLGARHPARDTFAAAAVIVVGVFLVYTGAPTVNPVLQILGFSSASFDLTPLQAKELVEKTPRIIILDVRTPEEYMSSHIPYALNIPLEEIPDRLGDLNSSNPILVYSETGEPESSRSAKATKSLNQNGFKMTYQLSGGMKAWREEGLGEARIYVPCPLGLHPPPLVAVRQLTEKAGEYLGKEVVVKGYLRISLFCRSTANLDLSVYMFVDLDGYPISLEPFAEGRRYDPNVEYKIRAEVRSIEKFGLVLKPLEITTLS